MTIAYIAHPIGGDIEANLADLRRIIRRINHDFPDVVPFCPYYADVVSLDDNIPTDRELGLRNGTVILQRGIVDELWLTGDCMSSGMEQEQHIARQQAIPVHNYIRQL